MRSPALALAVLVLLAASLPSALGADSEEARIEARVVELYVGGLVSRDFSLIRTICIPEMLMRGVNREGKVNVTSLDKWSKRFDPAKPPFEKLEHTIASVQRKGDAAQVRIDFVIDGKREITDFLQLLKIEGVWRIVSVIDD